MSFDVHSIIQQLIENGYNTPETLEQFGQLLYKAAEEYQEEQTAKLRAAVELPVGQNLSSVDLKMYSIPNFKTRLGPIYNLVDSGNAKNLTSEDYEPEFGLSKRVTNW